MSGYIKLGIAIICAIPFITLATKIEWTMYLGMALIIFAGGAGLTFVTKKIEGLITGAILAVLIPELLTAIGSVNA